MADVQHGPVSNAEAPGGPVTTPSTTGPGLHPTSRPPEGLERKSAAEAVGPENVAKASTMVVEPSAPDEPPRLHAPDTGMEAEGYHRGGGVKEKLHAAWQDLKEITPGTKEHKNEFGTDVALGGYRSQMGKR